MALRSKDSLCTKTKVYYSPGYKGKAQQFQSLLTKASQFYRQRYHGSFVYKTAVLDSTQWVTEKYPFGYLAYDSGWIFLPAAVSPGYFIVRNGLAGNVESFNAFLQREHMSATQLVNTHYYVNALHELGHYFIIDNQQAIIPDMFANELIATYVSYAYFKSTRSPLLRGFLDFASFIKTHYQPKYRNIEAMDSLYMEMGPQNFRWFHCNIALLCDQIYRLHGIGFIDYYLQTFRKGTPNHFTTQQVIDLLDKYCQGTVNRWAKKLVEEKGQRQ
jgi:hypothetical protein